MKRLVSVLLLGFAASMGVPAHAMSRAAPNAIPVVATSFSPLAPRVGQHVTVTAQFFLYQPKKHPQYEMGARLSVTFKTGTVSAGQTVLSTVAGTTTDKQGKAVAHFTVPRQAAGRWLWAYTRLSYRGKLYAGSARVQVARS